MARYQFSTVKLVPDLAKDEPVNIGVILYDAQKNKAYPKFTRNWKVVSDRTGISRLPNLKHILEIREIKTEESYLQKLSHKEFNDNLVITTPKAISIISHPQETLETLFDTQISIPSKDTIDIKLNLLSKWMDKVIGSMDFPKKSYQPKYIFKDTMVDRRYPYVFFKKNRLFAGIDYLSFISEELLTYAKAKSLDINMIKSQSSQKTNFRLFSAQEKDEIDLGKRKTKKTLELLTHFKIPMIFKNDSEYELDKIRHEILATV